MTAEQLTFTVGDTFPHRFAVTAGTHRRNDPPTSVAAAKAVKPGPDQLRCLEALITNGGQGTIDTVCAHFALIGVARDRGSLSRRLTDLMDDGYVRKTGRAVMGSRGRDIAVWEVIR